MSVYTWEKNSVGFFTLSQRWPNVGKYTEDGRLADGGLTLTKQLLAFLPVANVGPTLHMPLRPYANHCQRWPNVSLLAGTW